MNPTSDEDETAAVGAESKVEAAKRKGHFLRGTIAETLASDATHFDHDDLQLLKFHGSYQQDDRDRRKAPRGERGEGLLLHDQGGAARRPSHRRPVSGV